MSAIFKATEIVTIIGAESDCECSHCGRALKVGVKLEGFAGVFGSDCLARASEKQTVVIAGCTYVQKLKGEAIRTRAIVARKGQEYASQMFGWTLGGQVFKLVLKSDLKSI